MQERQLVEASLQNDEHGVQKVQNLGDVENIQDKANGGVLLVEGAAHHGVSGLPRLYQCLNTHVGAQHHLHHIVCEFNTIETRHRAGVLHDELAKENKA